MVLREVRCVPAVLPMSATPTPGTTPGTTLAEELAEAMEWLVDAHDTGCPRELADCPDHRAVADIARRLRERAALVRAKDPGPGWPSSALYAALTGPIAAPRETT
jgi:hypothetical protein